ncbi:sulfatase family protein [Rubinisphaera margarita]|uniref:sulfatase family protein n=1 Tax=Rubinisphaera margarita TaxID=2909586 RepID=UPI001EE7B2D7|nr:sulfatase [Rubinisphaera margarita]MCG6158193.1 sulfatase [Rubinisphaera margarita]
MTVIRSLLLCAVCCSSGAFSTTIQADVVPVPETVASEKIEGAKPRNVVFILSDDHRYDAMSFMGHPLAKTPHMDAMARNGAHLKNAFVTTSLCSPSRASILTGLYTFRHRVIDNQRPVPEGTLFFPQYLQDAGYKTGFIGKWHMGHVSDEPRPGFDYWFSFKGQGNYYPPSENYTLNDNGKRVPQDGYITTLLTRKAVEFLEQQSDSEQPFFLYLSHKAVHGPFTPEPKYKGTLKDVPFELPESSEPVTDNLRNRPRWLLDQRNSWHGMDFPLHTDTPVEDYYKSYCEALRTVDDSIGSVMEQLKKMGIYDDTVVIYMGDNGYMFGEYGLIDKRVAYETSSRVPMLMQCPSLIKGGTVVDEVVANIDIAPTVMEAMGLKKPTHMDGQSFLPLAQGQSIPWRDYFLYVYYWEQNFPQTPTHFSLRGDQYKYTTYYGLWDTDELYDIQADPMEQTNLIHEPSYEKIKNQMQKRLYEMMDELGGMQVPLNPPRGRQRNKRLRDRNGVESADFPEAFIVDEPLRKELVD